MEKNSGNAASKMLMNENFVTKKNKVTSRRSLKMVNETALTARHCGHTVKTLFRWDNSIYKVVWRHMLLYYIFYILLTVVYEYCLDETNKRHFEALTRYIAKNTSMLNLMFMLGFFTSTTLQRLFVMNTTMPGIAKIISVFIMSLKPDLPEGPTIINLYAKWALLSWVLAVRSVSRKFRQKYPTLIFLQAKEILQVNERVVLERAESEGNTQRPLVVIDWMLLLLRECEAHGRFNNKSCQLKNVELLMVFKKSCGNMIKFVSRNIPHSLVQGVIIAVYYYGLLTLMARDLSPPPIIRINQNYTTISNQSDCCNQETPLVEQSSHSFLHDEFINVIISYVPIMPFMQFFIFFAWLTFGRMAVNPFSDDETDIDLDQLLESHIEDCKRLERIYGQKLEDVFPYLPQKRFIEVTSDSSSKPDNSQDNNNAEKQPKRQNAVKYPASHFLPLNR